MDVLTIRERAKRLRVSEDASLKKQIEQTPEEITDDFTAAERQIRHLDELRRRNGLLPVEPGPLSEVTPQRVKLQPVRRRSRKLQVKQKNIQLRLDQIKGLREYVFRSGNINGSQLNDSQICRVALDLFFWVKVNPDQIDSEEQLLGAAKERLKKLLGSPS